MRTGTDIPSKERIRNILFNWSRWARDCPLDPAEVNYYTVSPMFAAVIPRSGGSTPYDTDSALMVEEVMHVMFRPYPSEYRVIQAYFGEGRPQREIAAELGIHQASVSKYRLPAAERIFAEQWAELIR